MEEKTYLGAQYGMFTTEAGRKMNYASVFVMEPFPDVANDDYHTTGYKCAKYKLADSALVEGLEPFDVVEVYFSSKGGVTKLVKKVSGGTADKPEQKKAS